MKRLFTYSALVLGLVAGFQLLSCGGGGDNEDPSEKLKAFCIRECVLETGDSSLCDTRCGCTAKTLADKFSGEDLGKFASSVTAGDAEVSEKYIKEYKSAFSHCKSEGF